VSTRRRPVAHQPLLEPAGSRIAGLTAQEREVFDLLARGLPNRRSLPRCSSKSRPHVTHVKRVLAKLGLRDRIQAVVLAYEADIRR